MNTPPDTIPPTPVAPAEADADIVSRSLRSLRRRPVPVLGRLMSLLKYPQKFALISAVFLLPLGLLLYFFDVEIGQRIEFARAELQGTAYLRPLQDFLVRNDEAGIAADAFALSPEARPAMIRRIEEESAAFDAVRAVTARDGRALDIGHLFNVLDQNWGSLRAGAVASSAKAAPARSLFADVASDGRALFARVGDSSNLILDPDLSSYYLMDATVLKWPRIQELLTGTRDLCGQIARAGRITPTQQEVLTVQLGVLRALRADLERGMGVAFGNDPTRAVERDLRPTYVASLQALENYEAYCRRQFLAPERAQAMPKPAEVDMEGARAVAAAQEFWQRAADSLDGLVQARIAGFEDRRRLVFLVTGGLLLAAAALFAAFYTEVMRTVFAVGDATARMTRGDYAAKIKVETRDELGEVVRAFNAVAARLREEYLQAKEESARARGEEERRKESEARFRSVFENAVDGMFQTTPDGHYLAANRALARIYGFDTPEELVAGIGDIGGRLYVDPRRRVEFREELERTSQVQEFVSEVYRRDGRRIWISENARAVRDAAGNLLYYEGTVTDVTLRHQIEETRRQIEAELRQAKDHAEKASKAKSQFLANMSHELRTPLNGILGYTQILKRSPELTPKLSSGVAVIHQSAEHLLTLINDILDLSKIEADKVELQPGDFDLRHFLEAIGGMLHIRASQKKIAFHEHLADDLPSVVRADEKRLRQVLINLLGNAVKFTEHGGVGFRVVRRGDRVRFSIEDTGVGIPEGKIDLLFQPFSQVGTAQQNAEGTGLGLALSQRLVTLMGSKIDVRSRPGEGSVFEFEIDLPEVALAPRPAAEKPREVTGYRGPRVNILIVDDRRENRAVLVDMLEPLGFETVQAENGREALERIAERRPDVILTDLVMPVMDGFEMTRKIREHPTWRDLLIVTVSASIFEFDTAKSRQAGCDDCVPKPVDLPVLLACLRTHLPKVEWIYQDEEEAAASAARNGAGAGAAHPAPADAPLPKLPGAVGAKLLDLARKGDVQGVMAEAEALAAKDAAHAPLAGRLRGLAETFSTKQMRQLIEELLPTS
ncbi:MAG TPA: ATP-binding protein [Candidatus Methylacidiphilales bacterium]